MLFIFNELRTATAAVTSDRLGEILLREGLITQDQLKKALLEQKNTGMRLGYTLVKLGFVEETEISKMLARQYRMPAVDLSRFEVDPKIIKLLPPDVAIKHTVLPLKREGRTLTVAIADPNNVTAIEDIKFITRCDVFPVIAGEYTLRNAIDKYYQQSDAQLQTLLKDIEAADDLEVVEEQRDEDVKAQDLADDAPVVKLINGLLTDAVKRGASDIHIEPFEHEMRVRYRAHLARQDHGVAQHRGTAGAAGRAHQAEDGSAGDRLPRLDPAGAVRREDRAAYSRQGQPDARPLEVRVRAQGRGAPAAGDPEPVRHGVGDGSDGVGKDDDALLGPVPHQHDGGQYPDRGGSGRVQPHGHQPGAGAQRGGDDVRGGAEGVPAPGPEHHHGGGDPGHGDRVDRDQGRAYRPPGAVDAAHQRRALDGHPHDRHGDRAVQRGERREPDRGAAAGAPHLLGVQGGAQVFGRGAARPRHSARRGEAFDVLQGPGLRHLRRDRVQGPAGAVRGHGHDEPAAPHGVEGGLDGGAARPGGQGGHAHAADGRHVEGQARHHHTRRSREGDGGMTVNLRALLEEMIEKDASDLHS